MKIRYMMVCVAACICLPCLELVKSAETGENITSHSVRNVWRMVMVDDNRNYDQMVSDLKKVIDTGKDSSDALTARFLIGRIEIDRVEAEAQGSYEKAKVIFDDLQKSHPKSWQGQFAKIALLFILQSEGNHAVAIAKSQKALGDIDWDLLGKNAPHDLIEYNKMANRNENYTPDILKMLIANSYLELKQPQDAEKWILKIENQERKDELQQQLNVSEEDKVSVLELWKHVIVDKSRNYNQLISDAEKIIKENNGKPDALTSELLKGRIEMDRALNEAEGSLDKARAIFASISKNNTASWQGQAAKISLVNILHIEGKHSDVITESSKGLKEINWNILGKDAPKDLVDYKIMAGADFEFTPDVLRVFLVKSYFELGKAEEAKQWAMKIESAEVKKETEQAVRPH